MRVLIVNADDFGQSEGLNRGIIEAHENGIVTSASLMVRWPAAPGAANYATQHPDFSVGLHVDLAEWFFRGGEWVRLYEVADIHDAAAVQNEVQRQIEMFRKLVERDPSHIDSHQHVHRHEPVHSIVLGVARELGIPCRAEPPLQYRGEFYGQNATGDEYHEAITPSALIKLLVGLPEGITELGCHPGFGDLDTMYVREREQEVRTLCDVRVQKALESEGITLRSFDELRWKSRGGDVVQRIQQ